MFSLFLSLFVGVQQGWKAEDVKFFRHAFVKCILATDLALSLEYVSKFQSLTTNMASAELSRSSEKGGEGRLLLLCLGASTAAPTGRHEELQAFLLEDRAVRT